MQKENEKLFWVTLMDGGRFEPALTPVTCFYELILDEDIKIDLVVVGVITAPLTVFFFFFLIVALSSKISVKTVKRCRKVAERAELLCWETSFSLFENN